MGLGASHSKYANNESKNDNLMIGGTPYLWVKFDPYNHYLRRVLVREGENIYLAQLEKEMKEQIDFINIYRILESLVTCATMATVQKMIQYVNDKEVD